MNYGDRLEELGEGLEELGSGRIKKNYPILSGFLDDVKLALSCHIQVGSGLACKYKQWHNPAAGNQMLCLASEERMIVALSTTANSMWSPPHLLNLITAYLP